MKTLIITLCFLLILGSCLLADDLLSPSDYLGKEIGADGVLADYEEIVEYLSYIASASEWIRLLNLGNTTLGNDFYMIVASHPSNLAEIERYVETSKSLRDARGVTAEQAESLADEGRVILLDMCCIHSDEIGSSQMALLLAHMIGREDPAIASYLENVILLLMPAVNPDGQKMIVDWYKQWKGTEYDGSWMPWLYHHYAGHDDNRDWYMFNLDETKIVSDVMYRDYVPQVILDHHEMWMTGARYFVPPYTDPVNPNIDPLVWREVELIGSTMLLRLQEKGLQGVISNAYFTGWWQGASVMTPLWHNVPSLLTEAASVRIATPVFVDGSELSAGATGFPEYAKLVNFPDPWEGGWWRLGDIIDYELTSFLGALEACSKHKESILYNFHKMCSSAIERGKTDEPYAYVVVPSDDNFTRTRMLQRLMLGAVEIQIAEDEFVAGGTVFPGGSHVILMSQPYRAYAKDMLEKQRYPEIRLAPEAPPLEPYDATAWTMPLKMGVETVEIGKEFDATVKRCNTIEIPKTEIPPAAAGFLAFSRKSLSSYILVNRALRTKLPVYTTRDTLRSDARVFYPGTFFIDISARARVVTTQLSELSSDLGLTFYNAAVDPARLLPLKSARIAVFQSYVPHETEGWMRYVLDDFEFAYSVLNNEDMKIGHLAPRYDLIIFPGISASIIKEGKPTGRWAEFFEPPPPQYSGGIGDDGIKALNEFLGQGGVIITTGSSCDFAIEAFELPVRNILKDADEKMFSCPGSVLRLTVNGDTDVGYGMERDSQCFFFYSNAFSTRIPYGKFRREIVATYGNSDLLQSGWIKGEERIRGKPAVVKVGLGEGDIVLIGFDPVHRGQTHCTYKIMFNSLLLAGIKR